MWSKVRGFIAYNKYNIYPEYLISCLIILSLFRMARLSLCRTGFEFRRSPRALALALANPRGTRWNIASMSALHKKTLS